MTFIWGQLYQIYLSHRPSVTKISLKIIYLDFIQIPQGPVKHWVREWLVAWRHQAITWTNRSLVAFTWMQYHRKITNLRLQMHLPGTNGLMLPYQGKWLLLLSHWGWVTHICVGNLTIIGSDNGLSSCRRQAIIWTNAEILLIGTLGTNFSEILIEIHTSSLKKRCIWKCCLWNVGHFVSASVSYKNPHLVYREPASDAVDCPGPILLLRWSPWHRVEGWGNSF